MKGTVPQNINDLGVVAGQFVDTSSVTHGFLRAVNGKITTINVPGAGGGSGQGTFPVANNLAGEVAGYYVDASGVYHGFLSQ
jgi:hypothetical protein